MRAIAVLAAIVVGALFGAVAETIIRMATGIESAGIGVLVGAVALAILVARLVPRSSRAQRRHDQTIGRQYPNRVIRRD